MKGDPRDPRELEMSQAESLLLLPLPEPRFGHADDDIARTAARRLEWSVQVPQDQIEVTVANGWVIVRGTVDWRYQKLAAETLVRPIRGVRGVTNLIRVKPRPYDADVREQLIDVAWTWQHCDSHG